MIYLNSKTRHLTVKGLQAKQYVEKFKKELFFYAANYPNKTLTLGDRGEILKICLNEFSAKQTNFKAILTIY